MTAEEIEAKIKREHHERDVAEAAALGISLDELLAKRKAFYRKLAAETAEKNKITYQEFVAWAEELACQLPAGPYRTAFLDTAKRRWGQVTPDDTMSVTEIVELDFRSIMRGMEYREGDQGQ